MRPRADLAACDRHGQLALLVEAKSRLNTNADWAAKMHRNLISHGMASSRNYFKLALPDNLYPWSTTKGGREQSSPNYVFSPEPFLQRHLDSSGPLHSLEQDEHSLCGSA